MSFVDAFNVYTLNKANEKTFIFNKTAPLT